MFALSPEIQSGIAAHGIRVALVLLLGLLAFRWMRRLVSRLEHRGHERGVRGMIAALRIGFFLLLAALIFEELGFASGTIIASLGILGLAVSFGGQFVIRDMLAGFFVLQEHLCSEGDDVTVNGHRGIVRALRLRTMTIETESGSHIHLPYGAVDVLENHRKRT